MQDVDPTKGMQNILKILYALSSGPSTCQYIRTMVLRRPDGSFPSLEYVYKVMKFLKRNEYVCCHMYYPIRRKLKKGFNVYTLAPAGINEICSMFAVEREFLCARSRMPRKETLKHDLMVADIVRCIKSEAICGMYKLDYVYDEAEMRRRVPPKEKVFYPDLRVRIHPKIKSAMEINIEVDAGTKSSRYWLKKLRSWKKNLTLVVCLDDMRMMQLFHAVASSLNRDKKEGKASDGSVVTFSSFVKFIQGGLKQTRWLWPPDREPLRLDI